MKKLSLLLVFVMLFVMLFAFNAFAATYNDITDEAELVQDGSSSDLYDLEKLRDGDYHTASSCGDAGENWMNIWFKYEEARNISKVFVVLNSTGTNYNASKNDDGSFNPGVYETLSQNNFEYYIRLYNANNAIVYSQKYNSSNAEQIIDEENNILYTAQTAEFETAYTNIVKVEIAVVNNKNADICVWEVEITDYECVDAEDHIVAEDDGNCTTSVLCKACGETMVEAKLHAFGEDKLCTNDGCEVIFVPGCFEDYELGDTSMMESWYGDSEVKDDAGNYLGGYAGGGNNSFNAIFDNNTTNDGWAGGIAPRNNGEYNVTFFYKESHLIRNTTVYFKVQHEGGGFDIELSNDGGTTWEKVGEFRGTSEQINTIVPAEILVNGGAGMEANAYRLTWRGTSYATFQVLIVEIDITGSNRLSCQWNDGEITIAPTCGADGVKTYTCKNCGDKYTEAIPATGIHTWDEGVVTKEATEEEDGTKLYTCTVCGDTYEEVISAIEHTYVAEVVAPTCTERGYTLYTCTGECGVENCDASYIDVNSYVAVIDHNYVEEVTVKATALNEGLLTYTCSACGNSYTKAVAKLSWGDNTTVLDSSNIVKYEATYNGDPDGNQNPADLFDGVINSTWTQQVGDGWYGPTGSTLLITLDKEYYVISFEFSVWANWQHPTLQLLDKDGNVLKEQSYYGLSCTDPTQYQIADNFVDVVGVKYIKIKCNSRDTTGQCCAFQEFKVTVHNHDREGDIENYVAPTCTEAGSYNETCSVCGLSYLVEVPALGHTWGEEPTSTVAPTCTVAGSNTYTCTVCSDIKVEKMAALGHTWVDATCTTAKTCSVCNTTEGEALGHSYVVDEYVEWPTCVATGLGVYKCTTCGDTQGTSEEPVEIPATGEHQYPYYPNDNTATCTEGGIATYICYECNNNTITKESEALGHDFGWNPQPVEVSTAATCETAGLGIYYCNRCEQNVESEIPALGHDMVEGEIDYETHTVVATCANECGKTETLSTLGREADPIVIEVPGSFTASVTGSWTYYTFTHKEGYITFTFDTDNVNVMIKDITETYDSQFFWGGETTWTGELMESGSYVVAICSNDSSAIDIAVTTEMEVVDVPDLGEVAEKPIIIENVNTAYISTGKVWYTFTTPYAGTVSITVEGTATVSYGTDATALTTYTEAFVDENGYTKYYILVESEEEVTIVVNVVAPLGTANNPIELVIGENTVDVSGETYFKVPVNYVAGTLTVTLSDPSLAGYHGSHPMQMWNWLNSGVAIEVTSPDNYYYFSLYSEAGVEDTTVTVAYETASEGGDVDTSDALELGLGDNAITITIENYYAGSQKVYYTATVAGTYILSAAEGEENAVVIIEGDYGSETVELPYSVELAEGESFVVIVSTSANVLTTTEDTIDLVLSKEAGANELVVGDKEITVADTWNGDEYTFTSANGGSYVLSTVNGWVTVILADGSTESVGANSYEFTLEAGETITFAIATATPDSNVVTVTIAEQSAHECVFVETSRVESTCTVAGNVTYTCECGETKTDALELATHTEVEIPAVDATCTTAGSTAGVKCSVCDEVLTAPEAVEATGHQYFYPCDKICMVCYEETNTDATHTIVHVEAVAATCTANGNIEYWYCSDCGSAWADEVQTQVTNRRSVVTPATGHTEVEIPAVRPTPSVTGYTAGVKCSECGDVLVAPVEVTVTDLEFADTTLRFNSISLSAQENISLNYKAIGAINFKSAYAVFVFDGKEYVVTEYTVDSSNRYVFNFAETRPQLMNMNVEAYIYAENDDGSYTRNMNLDYSVKKYIINQLKKNDANLTTVMSDILYMGAMTQVYMGVNTDALITDIVEAEGYTLTPTLFSSIDSSLNIQAVTGDRTTGTDWKAVNLAFGASTEINFKFATDNVEGLKVKVNVAGVDTYYNIDDLTYESDKGYYVVNVNYVRSYEYNEKVTATFERDGVQVGSTFEYSINTFLAKNYESTKYSKSAKELMKAIYIYGESIAAYFA